MRGAACSRVMAVLLNQETCFLLRGFDISGLIIRLQLLSINEFTSIRNT